MMMNHDSGGMMILQRKHSDPLRMPLVSDRRGSEIFGGSGVYLDSKGMTLFLFGPRQPRLLHSNKLNRRGKLSSNPRIDCPEAAVDLILNSQSAFRVFLPWLLLLPPPFGVTTRSSRRLSLRNHNDIMISKMEGNLHSGFMKPIIRTSKKQRISEGS